MAYNADDLVTSVTDDNAHATTQTFDNNGRPLVTTKANGDTFTNTYDGSGKKGLFSSTTDGNSHTITYAYTARNRKSSASYPDSTGESWTYDANGAAASHTDGKVQTTTYTLDHAGRLTDITFQHDTAVRFVYDAAGAADRVGYDHIRTPRQGPEEESMRWSRTDGQITRQCVSNSGRLSMRQT